MIFSFVFFISGTELKDNKSVVPNRVPKGTIIFRVIDTGFLFLSFPFLEQNGRIKKVVLKWYGGPKGNTLNVLRCQLYSEVFFSLGFRWDMIWV